MGHLLILEAGVDPAFSRDAHPPPLTPGQANLLL